MWDHAVIIIIIYLAAANLVAVIMTIHDKNTAERKKRRVPERSLLITAALSGCIGMYLTMRIIHHKTRKAKFMVGIPVIFALEAAAVLLIKYYFL